MRLAALKVPTVSQQVNKSSVPFFFNLRLLVTTRASPFRYTTGYLQRLLQLIPFTNLLLKYSVSIWEISFVVLQEFCFR